VAREHPYSDVAAEVVRIIDWESLGVPPRHGSLVSFRSLAKRFWLNSTPDLGHLITAIYCLCVYGYLDRARRVCLAMSDIRTKTPGVMYGYIHDCFTVTCCFLERAGYWEAAKPLRHLAHNPPGEPDYQLGDAAFDGTMVNFLPNDPVNDPYWSAYNVFQNISNLSVLLVFGSTSRKFPPDRVAELLDSNLAGLYTSTKWKPWPHPEEPIA